jgi:hypothetical protein
MATSSEPVLAPLGATKQHLTRDDAGAGAPPTGARRIAARGAVLFALFAVALEITCRVEDRIRFGTPILSRFTSQGDLLVRDSLGAHGRPNGRFQKWVLNGLGTRGPEVAPVPAPGTLRVVAAGASETFGLYESAGREYPRQLEDSLRASLAAGPAPACAAGLPAPTRVEVLNAALPGMSLPTVVQDLRLRVSGMRPDVVLLYATPAQYLEDQPPAAARPDSSPAAGDVPFVRALRPRALARVREQAKQMLPAVAQDWLRRRDIGRQLRARPAGWRYTGVPAERVTLFERDLRGAVGAVRAVGAEPVLATHANRFLGARSLDERQLNAWERFYPRAPGRVIVAFDSAANEATRRVARDSAVAIADLARALAGGGPAVFADFSHFTDDGAARVAGTLSATVAEAGRARLCAAPR